MFIPVWVIVVLGILVLIWEKKTQDAIIDASNAHKNASYDSTSQALYNRNWSQLSKSEKSVVSEVMHGY